MTRNVLLTIMTLLGAGVGHSAPAFATEDNITVMLPAMARAPAAVRAQVRIPAHPDNRLLRVTLDSGRFYRSSDVELEGAASPRTHVLTWKALPAGTYEVTVEVVGSNRLRRLARRQLQVIGME